MLSFPLSCAAAEILKALQVLIVNNYQEWFCPTKEPLVLKNDILTKSQRQRG